MIKKRSKTSKGGMAMAQLSDAIEHFIKELMEEDKQIEVKRNELAQHFGCAPSQINYVLAVFRGPWLYRESGAAAADMCASCA